MPAADITHVMPSAMQNSAKFSWPIKKAVESPGNPVPKTTIPDADAAAESNARLMSAARKYWTAHPSRVPSRCSEVPPVPAVSFAELQAGAGVAPGAGAAPLVYWQLTVFSATS